MISLERWIITNLVALGTGGVQKIGVKGCESGL